MADTRLPYDLYLTHIQADAERLLDAAGQAGVDAPVPTCPDWTVRDLVEHVGSVYAHKVIAMREGGPSEFPPPRDASPTEDYFRWALGELLSALRDRQPSTPAYTWWPAEQTAGFWARRMAQESLIHRVDAERAAGVASEVDEALSLDGVDEVLSRFVGDPDMEWPVVAAAPTTVAIQAPEGRGWVVHLAPDAVRVEGLADADALADAAADATIRGAGADLDLWLWGRGGTERLHISGSPAAVALLRERMATATE